MGLLKDIAMGKYDFVNGDVENLSDPRNWPRPKSVDDHSKEEPIKKEEEITGEAEESSEDEA